MHRRGRSNDDHALVGAWRLVSWHNPTTDAEVSYPMTADALGSLSTRRTDIKPKLYQLPLLLTFQTFTSFAEESPLS
jgi:hypothetical protein